MKRIIVIVFLLLAIIIGQFLYVINTRPRIEFLPDNPDTKWGKYAQDSFGADYPRIRIYHKTFFGSGEKVNFFQYLIGETGKYWQLRLADMDMFMVNWGWRRDGENPNFDEIKVRSGTMVKVEFGDIPPNSIGFPKKITIEKPVVTEKK